MIIQTTMHATARAGDETLSAFTALSISAKATTGTGCASAPGWQLTTKNPHGSAHPRRVRLQRFHICAVEFSVVTTEEARDACSKEVNEEVDEHEARVVG